MKNSILKTTLLIGLLNTKPVFSDEFSKFTAIDGDTIKAEWNIPHPMLKTVYFRLDGIDAPELFHPKCDQELELAKKAKVVLASLLDSNFHYEIISWDKYGGRILIKAFYKEEPIDSILIKNGLAVAYSGKKKDHDWCSDIER